VAQPPAVQAATAIFFCTWIGLAWEPVDRQTWLLENVLVVLGFLILWRLLRSVPLSPSAILAVLMFLTLHTIGAHFTYSMVPYDNAWISLSGESLDHWMNSQRNHYDRLVHFLYGALMLLPIRELLIHHTGTKGFSSWFLSFNLILSTSASYELIEWAAAEIFGGELGAAFLGMQGDEWDSQRDMALAALGAVIVISVSVLKNQYLDRARMSST
jgi:putative membrane protein